jgi:hypothetical protein
MLHSGWRVRFIDDDNDELKDLIIVQATISTTSS